MINDEWAQTALVTGGCGFIGSALVRHLISQTSMRVLNLDKLTYAGNPMSVASVADDPRYIFLHLDICDAESMAHVLARYQPDVIFHLAAESHVDRSIDGPAQFVSTNIAGTFNLLDASARYWEELTAERRDRFRFVHVSTDEVYGSLGETGLFTEAHPYAPNSPYSASKAGADHLVRAWHHTYGLPTVTSNCSNNYGPFQFPEKLIPLMILNALEGKPLPVYGQGDQTRDWLYVDDHIRALLVAAEKGRPGETYNVGGHNEVKNLAVVQRVCQLLDELHSAGSPHEKLISFVADRPGHDQRYAIDATKIGTQLGWAPLETFDSGLRQTVLWYLENPDWCRAVLDGSYQRERLGLGVRVARA